MIHSTKRAQCNFSYRCLGALIYIYLQVIQTYIYTQIPIPGSNSELKHHMFPVEHRNGTSIIWRCVSHHNDMEQFNSHGTKTNHFCNSKFAILMKPMGASCGKFRLWDDDSKRSNPFFKKQTTRRCCWWKKSGDHNCFLMFLVSRLGYLLQWDIHYTNLWLISWISGPSSVE